jgi:hypothetical protein
MPPDVIAMGMRNERPRLTAPKIDRQSRLGQFQTVFPVKKSFRFQESEFLGKKEMMID